VAEVDFVAAWFGELLEPECNAGFVVCAETVPRSATANTNWSTTDFKKQPQGRMQPYLKF
jgi:hypothetical protein